MQLISQINDVLSCSTPGSRLKIRDILPAFQGQQDRHRRERTEQELSTAKKTFAVSLGVAESINAARSILDTPGHRFVQMGNRQIICLSRLRQSDETIELILSFGTNTTNDTEISIQSSKTLPKSLAANAYKLIDSLHAMVKKEERKILSLQSSISWLVSVADNTESEPNVLEEVSNHPDFLVKSAVAANPSAPLKVLFRLAEDSSTDLRFALADNHNAATPVLEKLAHDRDAHVAWRARLTLTNLSAITSS